MACCKKCRLFPHTCHTRSSIQPTFLMVFVSFSLTPACRAAKLILESFMQRNFAGTLGRTEKQRLRLMCIATGRFTTPKTITDSGAFVDYEFRNRYQAKQWRSLMEVAETIFDELAAVGVLTDAEIECVAALAELM